MQFLVTVDREHKAKGGFVAMRQSFPCCVERGEDLDEVLEAVKKSIRAGLERKARRKLGMKVEILPFFMRAGLRGSKVFRTGEKEKIEELLRTGAEPGYREPPRARPCLGRFRTRLACPQVLGLAHRSYNTRRLVQKVRNARFDRDHG